jgi:hypothetical protein
LGDPAISGRAATPVRMPGLTHIVAVHAYGNATYVLKGDSSVWA